MKAGLWGVLAKDGQALLCDGTIFPEKLSTPKTLECLRFLAECGLGIDGVDLNEKKQNLADLQGITLTYPDDPALLVGMKVMATAEVELGTLDNQDLFMRCDYRVVKAEETPVLSVLTDTIRYLPEDVQAFVLRIHHRYTDMGLTCALEIKGYYTYIKYMYKRKDVWGFNNSMSNGYHINVKAANLDRYPDTIAALPPVLQAEIAKGFGCGRKREDIGHCDGGCRGLIVPLDETVLDIQEDVITWLDQEIASRQQK